MGRASIITAGFANRRATGGGHLQVRASGRAEGEFCVAGGLARPISALMPRCLRAQHTQHHDSLQSTQRYRAMAQGEMSVTIRPFRKGHQAVRADRWVRLTGGSGLPKLGSLLQQAPPTTCRPLGGAHRLFLTS